MKKHNGMRPLDVVLLLKIITLGNQKYLWKDVAHSLVISPSEISESLNRSVYASLLDSSKNMVLKNNLLDFLMYGLKYVFPQKPAEISRGMPTAHSSPFLSNDNYFF